MRGDEFLQATLGSMDRVHNLARRLVRDRQSAEDLVQETYLAAFRAWKAHRRPDRVEPWLATICLNLARSEHRRRRRRPDEFLDPDPAIAQRAKSDTAAEAIARLDREALQRALWALPEEQRIAIALVDLCGFTAAQAAAITRSPRGTILSRVHRGRKSLAARVRKEVETREP
jgi:RNA polymerase sigma-70 factor (ECF subfamily)